MKWKTILIITMVLTVLVIGVYMNKQVFSELNPFKLDAKNSFDKVDTFETNGTLTKNYSKDNERLQIKDINGTVIMDLRLLSNPNNDIVGGKNTLVAIFLLEDFLTGRSKMFDSISFIDLNTNKSISKDITWKYATYRNVTECDDTTKGIVCRNETVVDWVKFTDLSMLPSKQIRIGMFTDTSLGETVEWIPNIAGFQIPEWALWKISTAVYDNRNFTCGNYECRAFFLRNDSLKFYIGGLTLDNIGEYNITQAGDISSSIYSGRNKTTLPVETAVSTLFWKDDGLRFYSLGTGADRVITNNVTNAWNISSSNNSKDNFSVATQDGTPTGLYIRGDGLMWYMVGQGNDFIYEYNMSTAWLINSSTVTGRNLSLSTQCENPEGIFFKPDGMSFYCIGTSNKTVAQYNMSTAWNISSAVYSGFRINVSAQEQNPRDLQMNYSGNKLYVTGSTGNMIYEYTLADTGFPNWTTNSTTGTTAGSSINHSVNWTSISNLSGYIFGFCNGTFISNSSASPQNVTYNFTNSANNKAYWDSPAGSNPWTTTNEASSLKYAQLNVSDGTEASVIGDATNDEPFWRFNFTINQNVADINWIEILFTGRENATETATLYVWNRTNNASSVIGVVPGSAGNLSLNYTRGMNISKIINHLNQQLVLYVEGVDYDAPDAIFVDFVQVKVNYNSYSTTTFNCDNTNAKDNMTNDSFVSFSGASNWSNITKVVNTTVGSTIKWIVWANDSQNTWNSTDVFAYNTTSGSDTIAPKYSDVGVNLTSPQILDYVKFSTNWSDETQLKSYTFSWNATGASCDTWANDSTLAFTGTVNWSNVTKQIPATCLLENVPKIAFRFYTNDTAGNMNDTGFVFPFSSASAPTCWTYYSNGEYYIPSTCGQCVKNSSTEVLFNMSQFTCET